MLKFFPFIQFQDSQRVVGPGCTHETKANVYSRPTRIFFFVVLPFLAFLLVAQAHSSAIESIILQCFRCVVGGRKFDTKHKNWIEMFQNAFTSQVSVRTNHVHQVGQVALLLQFIIEYSTQWVANLEWKGKTIRNTILHQPRWHAISSTGEQETWLIDEHDGTRTQSDLNPRPETGKFDYIL